MRKPEPPLDQFTWEKAKDAWHRAERGGQDPIEALNNAGLLVTPARARGMSLIIARSLLDSLYGWTAVEMLRKRNRTGANATPADMYEAVLAYVTEYIKYVEEKGLDDGAGR